MGSRWLAQNPSVRPHCRATRFFVANHVRMHCVREKLQLNKMQVISPLRKCWGTIQRSTKMEEGNCLTSEVKMF